VQGLPYCCAAEGRPRSELRGRLSKGRRHGILVSRSDPSESRLLRAIGYEAIKMPPNGKLKEEEIAAVREWIRMGSPWPAEKAGPAIVMKFCRSNRFAKSLHRMSGTGLGQESDRCLYPCQAGAEEPEARASRR